MDMNGVLDVRLNRRNNPKQRKSFLPSEQDESNSYFNSQYPQKQQPQPIKHQNNQPKNANNKMHPRQIAHQLNQFIDEPVQSKNYDNHQNESRINIDLKHDLKTSKIDKKKNNFNGFENQPTKPQKPLKKVAGQIKKAHANEQNDRPQVKESPKNAQMIKLKMTDSRLDSIQLSEQEEKIIRIHKNIGSLNSSIKDIRDDFNELDMKQKQFTQRKKTKHQQSLQPFGVQMSAAKQRQIKQFLTLKKLEKKARRKKIQDYLMKQKYIQQLQLKEEQQLKQRDRRKKLRQLQKYSKFDEKHQLWKAEQQQRIQMAKQVIKRHQNQEKYHIKKLQQDEQKKKKVQQQKRKILSERKEYFKSVDLKQIQQHQRWHDDKIFQLKRERKDAKEQEQQRIAEQNNKTRELWRGKAHGIVQDEQIARQKKKRWPKQKLKKMNQYKKYVKKRFVPKTMQPHTVQHRSLKKSSSKDSFQSHRQVKRYPYYKGVAYRQVIQSLPMPKKPHELKALGNNYLQFVKNLPKKRQQSSQEELDLDPEDILILERKFNSIGKVKRQIHPLYDENRKKKLSMQVPKNMKRDQARMIFQQLKSEDEKLKKKQLLLRYQQPGNIKNVQGQQKDINQGLVQNIQKKLSLLAHL